MPKVHINVGNVRKFLKDRLMRDSRTFRGFETEWQHIHDLLARTAIEGESNSALLIGPRGSGKTTLITSVLGTLLPQEKIYENSMVVYLNGLLHTDDRLALISATNQLHLENAVDGKVFGSFSENLAFLLACLKAGDRKKSKSVIFILEEFDLFCNHHNQTLLYNLFDVAQSAQAPICVIGITCRLDVTELLEKRVKSRFSHRQIFLMPTENDIKGRIELFKELLLLPTDKEMTELKKKYKRIPPDALPNKELAILKRAFNPTDYKFDKNTVSQWNDHILSLAKNNRVISILQSIYDFDVIEGNFKTLLYQLISNLDDENQFLTYNMIETLHTKFEADDKVALLSGLSVLEICLLIAMKHHSEIYDRDPFNFEMILTRFSKFANSSSTMQRIDRGVVLKAFEHVKNLEFIAPVLAGGNSSKVQKEYQLHRLLLTYGQIAAAVNKAQNLPIEVQQWSQSSII